jgi:thiamine-phosphate diphosphorylase
VVVLTDRHQAAGPLDQVVAAAADGGARLVIMREKDLPERRRVLLAATLLAALRRTGCRLSIAGPLDAGTAGRLAGVAGVHLAATDPYPAPGSWRGLIGRSCHDPVELAAAAVAGASYATLSPIFASRSKPGYGPPLGLSVFAGPAPLPVYALGGVETPGRAEACVAAGACGVAVMGAVMRAGNPAAVVADLLAAVSP